MISSSDSDSSDSLAVKLWFASRRKARRYGVHPLNQERPKEGYFHTYFQRLKTYPERFSEHVRMSLSTFEYILNMMTPEVEMQLNIPPNVVNPISVEERLVVTLRFLATGNSYASLAAEFRLGHTTVSDIVKQMLPLLWKVLQPLHMKPPTAEGFREIAHNFYRKWGFPNCAGAIDGKHIRILSPKWSGTMFFNYKSYFSIVLQAVSDAEYRFIFIEVGSYGKESDGGIFRTSALYDRITKGTLGIPEDRGLPDSNVAAPFVFIGDEAYPLLKHLMKPYARRTLDPAKEKFNVALSRARKTIECAFGIAAGKWRILRKSIETNVGIAEWAVKAACVLHNVVIDKENVDLHHAGDVLSRAPTGRRNHGASAEAVEVRNHFKNFFNDV
ncbi:uncharacterized protein LOC135386404 [Ornithodoros turicata]|uniref:uncharacterized protein LOC135386404 n=1 Tax=Ornithodoros turicata TaxID=34597 RepID=UPI0031399E1A